MLPKFALLTARPTADIHTRHIIASRQGRSAGTEVFGIRYGSIAPLTGGGTVTISEAEVTPPL